MGLLLELLLGPWESLAVTGIITISMHKEINQSGELPPGNAHSGSYNLNGYNLPSQTVEIPRDSWTGSLGLFINLAVNASPYFS